MDRRDEIFSHGTYLKSLPDAEIDLSEMELTFAIDDGEDEPTVYTAALEWGVCPTCHGRGSHVNPSTDCHGVTESEFAGDPGFREDYFNGRYDVTCYECGGRTTSPTLSAEGTSKEVMDLINALITDEAGYRAECVAERRMGC